MKLLAIAGGSASGKTTLARALAAHMNCPAIHLDDYFLKDESQGPFFISSIGTRHFDRNHPDSVDVSAVLAELERLRPTEECAILEGNFALAIPAFRDQANVRVFVELEADTRILRKVIRNAARGQPLEQTAQFYLENARPKQMLHVEPSRGYADFTVRGDGDLERLVPLLGCLYA